MAFIKIIYLSPVVGIDGKGRPTEDIKQVINRIETSGQPAIYLGIKMDFNWPEGTNHSDLAPEQRWAREYESHGLHAIETERLKGYLKKLFRSEELAEKYIARAFERFGAYALPGRPILGMLTPRDSSIENIDISAGGDVAEVTIRLKREGSEHDNSPRS